MKPRGDSHSHGGFSVLDKPERGGIECPKCENYISRHALVCPVCGRLFPGQRILKWVLALVLVAIYIGILFWYMRAG